MKYEVRIGDEVVPAGSVAELERMVRQKTLHAETPVREGQGPWRPARQVPALRRFFVVDAWDAWDELEDVDVSSVVAEEPAQPEPEPVEALSPEPVLDPPTEPPELEPDALEPLPEPPSSASDPMQPPVVGVVEPPLAPTVRPVTPVGPPVGSLPEELGQVIDFPAPPPIRRSGGAAPAPKLAPALQPRPLPEDTGPPARWFALGGVVAVVAVGVGLWVWTYNSTARWTNAQELRSPPKEDTAAVAVEPEPQPELPPEPELSGGGELEDLERELRQTMRLGAVDVCTGEAEDIQSALLIELSRLKVRVAKVDTTVYAWSEGQSPCPEILDLSVTVHDRGELVRDLGSVALVVGKYIELHDWQLRDFQVAFRDDEGGLRGQSLDGERVRRFWGAELDLRQVVEGD